MNFQRLKKPPSPRLDFAIPAARGFAGLRHPGRWDLCGGVAGPDGGHSTTKDGLIVWKDSSVPWSAVTGRVVAP